MGDRKEALRNFLQWHQTLYGNQWMVEDAAVQRSIGSDAAAMTAFENQINTCMKCSLGKTRTKFVFGSGNPAAEIMFIGEAPGRDEDLQGLPFVGRSGKLLGELLQRFQLKREDVFIANILKCRPPNNRDPKPEEVSECIPYLHRQIAMIKPKILVALGRVAAQNLLNNQNSLKSMRRQLWQYQDIPLVVTFHPAYILRNMNMMDEGVNDFKFIIDSLAKAGNQASS